MALNTLTGYALCLLRRKDKILLVQRSRNASFAPQYFSIIGGSLEHNETFRQAAVREVAEETGLHINEENLSFIHTFYRPGTKSEFVAHLFACDRWDGVPENREPEKHEQIIWASLNKLPQPMLPAHQSILALIQQNILYSEQPGGPIS